MTEEPSTAAARFRGTVPGVKPRRRNRAHSATTKIATATPFFGAGGATSHLDLGGRHFERLTAAYRIEREPDECECEYVQQHSEGNRAEQHRDPDEFTAHLEPRQRKPKEQCKAAGECDGADPQHGKAADSAPPASEEKTAESNASKSPAAAKVEAKPKQIASEDIPSTSQAPKTLVVIKTASVRSEPSTKGKILSTLKKGTKVESLGRSGSWFKIRLSTGATGWVFNSLVTEQK